jgi:membrane-associated phospholipid phosphatase
MLFPTIISRIFDPFVLLSGLIIAIFYGNGLRGMELISRVMTVISILVIPPVLLLFYTIKKHWVKDWDISDRKQRVRVFLVFSFILIFDLVVLRSQEIIFPYIIILCFWFVGFFIITLFWKISGHTGVATLVILLVMVVGESSLKDWVLIYVLCISIPLIAWSRVALKKHTILQVIGGTVYALVSFFLARELHLI